MKTEGNTMRIFNRGLDDLMANIEEQVYWSFNNAEEIGSSDISCCVNSIMKDYYQEDINQASDTEYKLVRNYVMNCINNLPRSEAA
jgi:hypothetical protein